MNDSSPQNARVLAALVASQVNSTANAIAISQAGVLMALFSLVKTLEENGGLKPDQYESKLRATVIQPGAELPSYKFVATLADVLATGGHEGSRTIPFGGE